MVGHIVSNAESIDHSQVNDEMSDSSVGEENIIEHMHIYLGYFLSIHNADNVLRFYHQSYCYYK